jgi:hypothetical protein
MLAPAFHSLALLFALALLRLPPLSFSRFSSLRFSTLRARILKLLVAHDLGRSQHTLLIVAL